MNLNWKKALQYGLITGVAIWYVCLVGMVEEFDKRDVVDGILSLGLALLVVIGLGMGYFTARKLSNRHFVRALVASVVTGLIGGVMSVILIILIESCKLR